MFDLTETLCFRKQKLYGLLSLYLFITLFLPNYGETAEPDIDSLQDTAITDATVSGEKIRVFLIAKDQATISSQIDGKIIELPFVMGDTFEKGDLLVELDPELAQAARDKAEAELKASQTNFEAIEDLRSRDDATLVELINAQKDVASARAGLILARKNLQMCRIIAPFSGRVIKVEKNRYELAKAGEPLISIINDNTLLASFLLPISEFPRTKIGQEIILTIPVTGQNFTARISRISATLDAASNTFEVAADLDNSKKLLRAGMSGWFTRENTAPTSGQRR